MAMAETPKHRALERGGCYPKSTVIVYLCTGGVKWRGSCLQVAEVEAMARIETLTAKILDSAELDVNF
jgi:hypothetical protein